MSDSEKLYTVKWPKAADHRTRSLSGVTVETNAQHQIALHFFNECRELEEEVVFNEQGLRTTDARSITYTRELVETMLLNEDTARQLRDSLNALFPVTSVGETSH